MASRRLIYLIGLLTLPAVCVWLLIHPHAPKAADPAGQAGPSNREVEKAPASLLGVHWDFSDRSLAEWKHKDNADVSIVEEQGRPAMRLRTSFRPYRFAWVTRYFEPHTTAGVVHVVFRVHGDSSGHELQVHFGAPAVRNGKTLYYINARQGVKLDFTGWRTVRLDLDQFRTPDNGLRDRDLDRVIFLEFTVLANNDHDPLDIRLDDISFTGRTPQEIAEQDRMREERERRLREGLAVIERAEKRLAALGDELDRAAAQGKFVATARIYWTALEWCAKDARRMLAADELEIVRQAEPMLAALDPCLAEPQRVLKHVRDRAPEEGDPFDAARNPFFKSVIGGIRSAAKSERSWAKGRRGYHAIPDAWTFRRLGDESYAMVWAMTRAKSPLRHCSMLLTNALNVLETIAHQHTLGDFNVDRTAAHGRDANINRFCLAPALDAWWELTAAYPDLLPLAQRAYLEEGLKRLADYQVTDHGLARLAKHPEIRQPAYPNMDVHYLLIMELAHRLWKEPSYARERDGFLRILQSAVYPMGAFAYIHLQNECHIYHQLDVAYLARFGKLSGDPAVWELLRKTIPYYPYNVEPAGMPEYYTDPSWKHYWAGGEAIGPGIIAGLFGDPRNQRVAETCAAIWGYGRGHVGAIAAEAWKPVAPQPLPDNYVIHDTNICGPHGRYGPWSFAGNGRNYGVGFQGKDTFVGCMLTDPQRRPLPLDSAVQVVTAEVRLNRTENHWLGGRCFAAQERLSTALGPDFGSLAVRYTVIRPQWQYKQDETLPWEGVQTWYCSKSRLVGLVSLESTADDRRAAIHGRIRLGLKRTLEPAEVASGDDLRRATGGASSWNYGRMRVTIHAHNYAAVTSEPSETTVQDDPKSYRSTEITLRDPVSVAAGEHGEVTYKKGTRYWYLVEIRAGDSPPAENVQRIEEGGLVGFRFHELGRRVFVLHNPSEAAIDANLPLEIQPGIAATWYDTDDGKGRTVKSDRLKTRLEAHRHMVAIVEER